jgi:hypothetical protein
MAYSNTGLRLITQGVGGGGRQWYYESADPIATVNTAGYFADGYRFGMRVGDTVTVRDTATPTTSLCTVMSANPVTFVADVSDGTAIAQTNTD